MIILICGPESSGTRFIAECFSQHPMFKGTKGHDDPLDDFWTGGKLPKGNYVTRRSIPSGLPGEKARYMSFPPLRRLRGDIFAVVTVRSPFANIASWVAGRLSTGGSREKAWRQYEAAYRRLFLWLQDIPYLVLPLEAVVLDGEKAINGCFRLMGLPSCDLEIEPINPNSKRYECGI